MSIQRKRHAPVKIEHVNRKSIQPKRPTKIQTIVSPTAAFDGDVNEIQIIVKFSRNDV